MKPFQLNGQQAEQHTVPNNRTFTTWSGVTRLYIFAVIEDDGHNQNYDHN